MRIEDVETWISKSVAVREASLAAAPATLVERSMMMSQIRKIAALIPDEFPAWTEKARETVVDFYVAHGLGKSALMTAVATKCVRVGYALAGDDRSALLPSDMGFLTSHGFVNPPSRDVASRASTAPDAPYAVEFAASFPQAKRRSTACFQARTTGIAYVNGIGEDQAQVAWRLSMGEGRDPLEVREYDGALYRPILAPGRTDPIRDDEFVRACADGDAWADCPFIEREDGVTQAVSEFAKAPRPMTGQDALARETALREAVGRAGRLLSIGGLVHRETPTPTLHLATSYASGFDRPGYVLAWRVAGLSMGRPQEPIGQYPAFDFDCGFGRDVSLRAALSFDAAHPGPALDVGREMAGKAGTFDETIPCAPTSDRAAPDALAAMLSSVGRRDAYANTRGMPGYRVSDLPDACAIRDAAERDETVARIVSGAERRMRVPSNPRHEDRVYLALIHRVRDALAGKYAAPWYDAGQDEDVELVASMTF